MGLATVNSTSAETALQDIGEIISVSGSRASILLKKPTGDLAANHLVTPFIGALLVVDTRFAIVVCVIASMSTAGPGNGAQQNRVIEVELSGELKREPDGYLKTFRRGISVYPRLGDRVYIANDLILQKVYEFTNRNSIEVGTLYQNPSIPALVKIDEMLGKHFAIVGSTGTGKSCAVALLLRQILSGHPNAHVVLLDPHNEYGTCFGDWTERVKITDLTLPFWLLTFEEAAEILVGDVEHYGEEIEILRELIPIAKRNHANPARASAVTRETGRGNERYNVDVPIPYRISDILQLLEVEMGRLEKTRDISKFKRLKARISTIVQDPRYAFMFGNYAAQDNLAAIIKRLFRIPVAGRPITVIEMMGLPSEVVNVVVSVLARLAFDIAMWSDGQIPVTFVCEEAHRYVPKSTSQGFEPTKRAISRIAKEGRKYGASLCVVSQRPGDLDPTILSQCSTIFSMRLSNENDQNIIQSALADASVSLLDFLPSLGTRECVVFGEGVTLPSRIIMSELPPQSLPKGHTALFADAWAEESNDPGLLDSMIAKWRHIDRDAMRSGLSALEQAQNHAAPSLRAEPNRSPNKVGLNDMLFESFGDVIKP